MTTRAQGAIVDQTQLLQVAQDTLSMYNSTMDPMLGRFFQDETREVWRAPQGPIPYEEAGDGANTLMQRQVYRLLTCPMRVFHTETPWTVMGLQDSLPSDVRNTINAAIKGDVEQQQAEFFKAILTARTASVADNQTAYRVSWYNGELDVPAFKNSSFTGVAHAHFDGTNSATLTLGMIDDAAINIREHGYGDQGLIAFFNSAQEKALKALLNITVASSLNTPMRTRAQDDGIHTPIGIDYAGITMYINNWVPAGYFVMFDPFVVPVRRRVHYDPSARGLLIFTESFNENYPLAGQKFFHRMGFSVAHQGAGVARQIVASTSYATPTFRI